MALSGRSDGEGGTVQDIETSQGNPAYVGPPDTVQVKINGKVETWEMEKVISEAQKGAASTQKWQEAQELLTQAKGDTDLANAVRAVQDSEGKDDQAIRMLGALMGMDGNEIEGSVQQMHKVREGTLGNQEDPDGDDQEDTGDIVSLLKNQQDEFRRQEVISYDKLDPKLQAAMSYIENDRINKIVDGALDNDEQLTYHTKTMDPDQKTQFRAMVDRNIQGRLASTGQNFGDGTRVLNNVLTDIRSDLKSLGTPKSNHTPTFGIGSSPNNDVESTPQQEPDHVSSTDTGFEQHITEVIQANMSKEAG